MMLVKNIIFGSAFASVAHGCIPCKTDGCETQGELAKLRSENKTLIDENKRLKEAVENFDAANSECDRLRDETIRRKIEGLQAQTEKYKNLFQDYDYAFQRLIQLVASSNKSESQIKKGLSQILNEYFDLASPAEDDHGSASRPDETPVSRDGSFEEPLREDLEDLIPKLRSGDSYPLRGGERSLKHSIYKWVDNKGIELKDVIIRRKFYVVRSLSGPNVNVSKFRLRSNYNYGLFPRGCSKPIRIFNMKTARDLISNECNFSEWKQDST